MVSACFFHRAATNQHLSSSSSRTNSSSQQCWNCCQSTNGSTDLDRQDKQAIIALWCLISNISCAWEREVTSCHLSILAINDQIRQVFSLFLGHKSQIFFYFAYVLKATPTLAYFMLKMIRSEIFCKNSHWKGVKTLDLWSAQYFSCPNHCNFQSKIVEKVLILKLYNLAHFILALWLLRLPRAFLEKWCVSIKSVCYFNSVLLWWFEVCTVEINYQSQSRQSHGSCYRLRNWTVKNIHCLHFMLIRISEKVWIIQSYELTVISTWTAGYAWQLENSSESHYWPVSQPIYM